MELRPYQKEAISSLYAHLRAKKESNPCIVIPTGGGKTPIIASICEDAVKWGSRVLIVSHVKELIQQSYTHITSSFGDNLKQVTGIYSAGLKSRDTNRQIIVASVQSIYKRAFELGSFGIMIVDEAHLIPPSGEGRYRRLIYDMTKINPKLRVIGLTATPYRLKSGMICHEDNILNEICYEVGVDDLISQGYLSPLISKASETQSDLSGVGKIAGEYDKSQVEDALIPTVKSAVAEIVEKTRDRKSVLLFCAGVNHADLVGSEIERVAPCTDRVGEIYGSTSQSTRDLIVSEFKQGKLKYLVNVNVLTTGFDAPNVDCVCLLRMTTSPGLYYQMVGRGFRVAPGKDNCLVLDFGENVIRHGPVNKIKPIQSGSEESIGGKVCQQCRTVNEYTALSCLECGAEFPPPKPKEDLSKRHHGQSSSVDVVDTRSEVEHSVLSVTYNVHRNRKDPEKPNTLRVDWILWGGDVVSEWVCFDHVVGSYPRQKAIDWWEIHGVGKEPDSVDQAIETLDKDGIVTPTLMVVDWSGKYPRIKERRLDRSQ